MAIYTPPINMDTWYPDKQDVVSWVYDIWRYLNENPIVSENTVEQIINDYLSTHPIDIPVKTVNGKTGNIVINYNDVGAASEAEMTEYKQATAANTSAISSINDVIPTLATKTALATTDSNVTQAINNAADAETKADAAESKAQSALTAAQTAFSPNNAPPYPVTKVNNKTGNITLYEVKNILLTFNAESNYYPYELDSSDYFSIIACNAIETSSPTVTVYGVAYNQSLKGFQVISSGDNPVFIRVLVTIQR